MTSITPKDRPSGLSRARRVARALAAVVSLAGGLAATAAHADALDALRGFMRDTPSGKGEFTQTVTSADGARKKVSSGSFEFLRPNRFRFVYRKPYEQVLVADGQKVWIYDPDLQQASARRLDAALDSTPAALLAGGNLEKDFVLKADGTRNGLEWVLAQPRNGAQGNVRELRVGLRDREPMSIEILDNFGQRSLLQFSAVQYGLSLPPASFQFKPPPGVDVVEQ